MPRRKKQSLPKRLAKILVALIVAPIVLFLGAAALGSLIPINGNWEEPDEGITVYLSDNGVHLDIIFPVEAGGLSWRPDFPAKDFADPRWLNAQWIMIGAGDEGIYTTAEDWADLRPGVALNSITGGDRVMHVQWVSEPESWAAAEIRLRPEEYRRLFAAARSSFTLDGQGRPEPLGVEGYFGSDAFYDGLGPFNAIQTCNQWVASRLRIAGVETSLWAPFSKSLPWRYRAPGDP